MMRRYIFSLLILLQSIFAYSEYTGPKTFGVELYNGYADVTYYGELKNIPLWNDKEPLYVEVFDDDGELVSHAWISENNRSFRIDEYGLYSFKVLQKIQVVNTESDSEKYASLLKWEQDVYIPQEVSFEAELLAEQYKPVLVFNKNEEYFPIPIDEILEYGGESNDGVIDIGTTSVLKSGYHAIPGEDLKGFMQYNGHRDFWFDFGGRESTFDGGDLYLRELKSSRDGVVKIYWDAIEENNTLHLMYYFFYAFDPKTGDSDDPAAAAHAFDRESFLITFNRNFRGEYEPSIITYAGHLENQRTQILGCDGDSIDSDFCNKPEFIDRELIGWSQGRTSVDWDYIHKIGKSPVLYMAQGAHAIYPTYGFYGVKSLGEKIRFLTEEAGSISDAQYYFPDDYELEYIDFSNKPYMSFSGDWVDVGFAVFENAAFPPFIRTPYDRWFSGTTFDLDNCLDYDDDVKTEGCDSVKDDYLTYIRGLGTLNVLKADFGVNTLFQFKFVSQSGENIPIEVMSSESSFYTILYDAELTYPSRPFLVYARLKGNENWVDCGVVIKSSMKNYMYVSEEVELSCDAYDRDDDGYTDSEEVAASSDPLNADSTPDDLDGDGVPNVDDPAPEDPSIPSAIEAPADLQAVAENQAISLSWTEIANAVTYNVYYSTESFAGIKEASNLAINGAELVGDVTDNAYLISGLENDSTYYIVVTALNTDGEESAPSNEVSGTPKQQVVVAGAGKLNDTGIIVCADVGGGNVYSSNELDCAAVSSTDTLDGYDSRNIVPAGQDAHFGRDSQYLSGSLRKRGVGRAGFDFSKIGSDGNELENDISDWSCVRDNVTGLVWENPNNRSWYTWYDSGNLGDPGDDNSNPEKCFNHIDDDESSFCNTEAHINRVNDGNLCGLSHWRLPTEKEIINLFDFGRTFTYSNGPTVRDGFDPALFSNIERSGKIWCDSNSVEYDEGYACSFSASEGAAGKSLSSSGRHYLMLISGEKTFTNYKNNSNHTVLDSNTGLMWKSCPEGKYGDDCASGELTKFGWHDALRHAAYSDYSNFTDWRLPSIKELASLIHYEDGVRSLDRVAFPNSPECTFMSSSADLSDPQGKRYLSILFPLGKFSSGYKHDADQAKQCVRLVRDSQ